MYQGWGGVGCVMEWWGWGGVGVCHGVVGWGWGGVCHGVVGWGWGGGVSWSGGGWGGVCHGGGVSWRGGGGSYTEQLGYRGQPSLSTHLVITQNYWGNQIQLQPHT